MVKIGFWESREQGGGPIPFSRRLPGRRAHQRRRCRNATSANMPAHRHRIAATVVPHFDAISCTTALA